MSHDEKGNDDIRRLKARGAFAPWTTASGKSALALALAERFEVEIVSIDSALVYRGMDIGSAKPTAEELRGAPHHLIDIREIDEPYSAADFVTDAVSLLLRSEREGAFR